MNLTEKEQKLFHCLENVNPESIWGLAISRAIKEPTEEKFRSLVAQLQSQERDNPQIMREILNEPCYQTLIEL